MEIYRQIIISSIFIPVYIGGLEPFCHEMGHALALTKYENYAAVVFYLPFFKKFRVKIGKVEIFNVRNRDYKNITYSKSDFLELEDYEIVRVAKAGVRNSRILSIVLILIGIASGLLIFVVFPVMILFIFFYAEFFEKEFNDFKAIRNPKEFRERIIQYPSDYTKIYKNLINEYEK